MSARRCSIDGCEKLHYAKGWCNMHYTRWRTHGDPLVSRPCAANGDRLYGVEDINWDVLPHDEARAALARYLTGEDRDTIATEFGVVPGTVMSWLARSKRAAKRSDSIPLPRDELKDLLLKGWRREDLAVHFNCSDGHLRNEISRYGLASVMACRLADWRAERTRQAEAAEKLRRLQVEERRSWYAKRDAEIVQSYLDGATLAEVGQQFQMDQAQAWRILNREGVDTSRRKYGGADRPAPKLRVTARERRLRAEPALVEFS